MQLTRLKLLLPSPRNNTIVHKDREIYTLKKYYITVLHNPVCWIFDGWQFNVLLLLELLPGKNDPAYWDFTF